MGNHPISFIGNLTGESKIVPISWKENLLLAETPWGIIIIHWQHRKWAASRTNFTARHPFPSGGSLRKKASLRLTFWSTRAIRQAKGRSSRRRHSQSFWRRSIFLQYEARAVSSKRNRLPSKPGSWQSPTRQGEWRQRRGPISCHCHAPLVTRMGIQWRASHPSAPSRKPLLRSRNWRRSRPSLRISSSFLKKELLIVKPSAWPNAWMVNRCIWWWISLSLNYTWYQSLLVLLSFNWTSSFSPIPRFLSFDWFLGFQF